MTGGARTAAADAAGGVGPSSFGQGVGPTGQGMGGGMDGPQPGSFGPAGSQAQEEVTANPQEPAAKEVHENGMA